MGFIPAQGSKIDTKELHLARKYHVENRINFFNFNSD
jgi:hypothetical protein